LFGRENSPGRHFGYRQPRDLRSPREQTFQEEIEAESIAQLRVDREP